MVTTTTSENLGRPQIKRPTSLNVSKPTGRLKKTKTKMNDLIGFIK